MKRNIPYGRQSIGQEDIDVVVDVLRSDWLTTGPCVSGFEEAVTQYCNARYGVVVTSGTASLHTAMYALGIGPGDEVIVPTMTFAATANCVVFMGAKPVFCDVNETTLLIDPDDVRAKIGSNTKAIIAVDFAGQPCDYDVLREIADEHHVAMIADACHSIGAGYKGRKTGSLADISLFSFHPVKHITTGEGGMAVTDNQDYCERMKLFRNHGITTDFRQREEKGSWFYEMVDLGFNYRITDFQCALGMSQLRKLDGWIARRQQIAQVYSQAFEAFEGIEPLETKPQVSNAFHLYVIKLTQADRTEVFGQLRAAGIGVNVHYIPVHLHPFYRNRFGTRAGMCPVAEKCYEQIISLPMYPSLPNSDIEYVIEKVKGCLSN